MTPAVPLERDLTLDFSVSGDCKHFQGWGWSAAELRYSWTLGRSSRLYLRPPVLPGTYFLMFETSPFLWGDRSGQRLDVFVNGGQVGSFTITEQCCLDVEVPWSLIGGRETLAITFEHPHAARPRKVNGADDDREIALAFERLALFKKSEPIEAEAPPITVGRKPGDLMMQFESLGQNCEFGILQRQCGAEPLSLLRFASTPLPALLAALRDRFSGLGAPGQVEVQEDDGQYLIVDKRFDLLYHSWIDVGAATPEQMLAREERRLPFLRQKLIEDLEEGGKIFVYHGMDPLSRATMLSLSIAMRAYGPATLLWVELADDTHSPGTVEEITPGLLKGYMDRFAPGENAHDLSFDSWIAVCRNAYAMTQGI